MNLSIRTKSLCICPVCNSPLIETELQGFDFETKTGEYKVDRCKQCNTVFTNPQPLEEDIPKLYQSRTTPDFSNTNGISAKLRELSISRQLNRLMKQVDVGTLKALDYGCGDGFFTYQMSKSNFFSHVVASDFHINAPPLLKSSKIKYLKHDDLIKENMKFDIIFCRHVLEHVLNPIIFIEQISTMLKPRGNLVLEVPNYQSKWVKILGKYYFGLYLPRHLYHYNKTAFRTILNDFDIKSIESSHTPLLGKSLSYLTGIKISNLGFVGLVLFPLQILIDSIFGTSSTLSVIAKKKG